MGQGLLKKAEQIRFIRELEQECRQIERQIDDRIHQAIVAPPPDKLEGLEARYNAGR